MPNDLPALGPALPRAAAAIGDAGPAELYRERVEAGVIYADPAQQRVVGQLQQLSERLRDYRPLAERRGLLGWLGLAEPRPAPRGIYLWGPVGRGKSMLMDLFFTAAPVKKKRRVHFHSFMLDVHERIEHERRAHCDEPVRKVAANLAAEATLLCFDEFQVNDIADAMIIGRLFRGLFEAGTVVVATSNRPTERLYENGLQRDRFLPFIALLGERLDKLELDSGRDYRLARMRGKRVYHWPNDEAAHAALEAAFADLTDRAAGTSVTLTVMARPLVVPRVGRNVAWFSFEELCERPLAAADYLAIAER
ncbi:MAG TPA: cell division protein ZapE, partial [Stellaceae bacterium]|nr:cell division protein ZapE [Stellaceae bacterium]